MPTQEQLDQLGQSLSELAEYSEKSMVSRPEWGSINFETSEPDFRVLFELVADLQNMPLRELPENATSEILSALPSVHQCLDKIDNFDLDQEHPSQARENLANQLHQALEGLTRVAAPWVPYLAYRRGDITRRLEQLEESLNKSRDLYNDAEVWVQNKRNEIEETSEAAREAAAHAGAAVFSKQFLDEASNQQKDATAWLTATGVLAVITLGAALAFLLFQLPTDDLSTTIQRVALRILVIAILFTATIWCGRIYRALRHQSAVNKHRGLAISTLQAFVHAAADARTKDAVLMEATRAVFGRAPTGYVADDQTDRGQEVQFVEFGKALTQSANDAG